MKLLRSKKITIVVFVLLVYLILYAVHRYALWSFENLYEQYSVAAQRHDSAALIPALSANPLRRDLNAALADVLSDGASAATRLKRAQEGNALLVLADGGLDAIGEVGEEVQKTIYAIEQKNWWTTGARSDIAEFTALAKKRAEIIADVRGLSYRANHQTKQIFDHLIAEQGILSSAYVRELNDLLPSVEEQFDARTNLYSELERVGNQTKNVF